MLSVHPCVKPAATATGGNKVCCEDNRQEVEVYVKSSISAQFSLSVVSDSL